MRAIFVLTLALTGTLGAFPAGADETPIDIKTDLEGQYFLVEQGGTAEKPTMLVKRAAEGYNHFVKREFDCAARTVRYLGEGESLEELKAAQPDKVANPIKKGTIAYQLWQYACGENGTETKPSVPLTAPSPARDTEPVG